MTDTTTTPSASRTSRQSPGRTSPLDRPSDRARPLRTQTADRVAPERRQLVRVRHTSRSRRLCTSTTCSTPGIRDGSGSSDSACSPSQRCAPGCRPRHCRRCAASHPQIVVGDVGWVVASLVTVVAGWYSGARHRRSVGDGGDRRCLRSPTVDGMAAAAHDPLTEIRRICLALPETSERLSHGSPTFFIRDKKTFTTFHDGHHGDDRVNIWCPAPPGVQDQMVEAEPERFFRPPYVGGRGLARRPPRCRARLGRSRRHRRGSVSPRRPEDRARTPRRLTSWCRAPVRARSGHHAVGVAFPPGCKCREMRSVTAC